MSKLLLFDWRCKACNHEFEELAKSDVFQIQCPKCSEKALRIISCPRIDKTAMALQDGATETSIRHFERIHQSQKAKEERSHREHGDYGKSPGSD
jgi:putative FmdB family regulatory protein